MPNEDRDIKKLIENKISYTTFFSILGVVMVLVGGMLMYLANAQAVVSNKVDDNYKDQQTQYATILNELGDIKSQIGQITGSMGIKQSITK